MYYKKLSVILLISFVEIFSQTQSTSNFRGVIFGDYFYKQKGPTISSTTQYADEPSDYNAFEIRRFNLIYQNDISEEYTLNFLIEANDGTLDSKTRLGFYLKNAFLEWKNYLPNHNIAIGLVPTPTWVWGYSEKAWGYRSIEKSSPDLRGFGSPTDFGISLRGKLSEQMNVNYVFTYGNGSGFTSEKNRQKKVYGAINFSPIQNLTAEVYADFEENSPKLSSYLIKGLLVYQTEQFSTGMDYALQTKNVTTLAKVIPASLSVYGKYKIPSEKNLTLVGRFDYFDLDTKVKNIGYSENLIILGLDYAPNKNIHFIPNLWVLMNKAKDPNSSEKNSNLIVRVTFQFNF
ncbi:MAG: hypothetical protein O3A55_02295 [Bacteroidetes bacterium]|nr:hypothetical protein [Bacteroidota bacterium]